MIIYQDIMIDRSENTILTNGFKTEIKIRKNRDFQIWNVMLS